MVFLTNNEKFTEEKDMVLLGVMASNSSSAASAQVAVAIALHSVNT